MVSVRSGSNYQLSLDSSENDPNNLGLYALVLVPITDYTDEQIKRQQQSLADLLEQVTQAFDKPLIWPLLLEAIGDKEKLLAQLAIEKKHGM